MNTRKKRSSVSNKTIAYIATVLVHALIIGALFFNFSSKPKPMQAHSAEKVDVVNATTVDEADIKKQLDLIKQQDLDKQQKIEEDQKTLKDLKDQAEEEKKNIEDLKKKQADEKEKASELEAERKKIALEKAKEEKKLEEEKKERERKDKIEKQKAADKKAAEKKAAEKKRREAEEAERQEALAAQMAAEDAIRAEQRAATLSSKYAGLIKEQVNRYRTIAPDFERWLTANVNVKLSPSGDVQSVRIVKSSGNARYDRSVETAIRQASPLPIPSVNEDPAVNKIFRDLNLIFDMTGL